MMRSAVLAIRAAFSAALSGGAARAEAEAASTQLPECACFFPRSSRGRFRPPMTAPMGSAAPGPERPGPSSAPARV